MNVKFFLLRIRRKLHSRIKVHDIVRNAYWLEFENENILSFLVKYNIVIGNHKQSPSSQSISKIQDYAGIDNEPGFIINVLESSNS